MHIPLKLSLELTDFEAPKPRELRHLVTVFVPGRPSPKQRLRHIIAGKWSKYQPHKFLPKLKDFLSLLQFCFAPPELPADELKEKVKEHLPCLMAIENLPEGKPKVIGFTPRETTDFENQVALTAQQLFKEPTNISRIAVYIKVTYQMRNWADLDNLEKSLLDGLQKGRVFNNDRQVEVHLTFRDYHNDKKTQGVFIKVYELEDDLKPIRSYYLGDEEAIKKATQAVADQLKKK